MMIDYTGFFKCRGCGAIIERKIYRNLSGKSVCAIRLENLIKRSDKIPGVYNSEVAGTNFFAMHRCDPDQVCVCDFIGRKVSKDGD